MKTRALILSSTAVAMVLGAALLLRPSRTIHRGPELAPPARIPPAARAIIASKMRRHAEQLPALLMNVVVLDREGVARVGGEIFDEPALARPLAGDELNGLLPQRFFELQDAMRAQARQVVAAAARPGSPDLSSAFGELTRTCVSCHAVYLNGAP